MYWSQTTKQTHQKKICFMGWLAGLYNRLPEACYIMHQSFVTPAPPTYGDGRGIAGLMCGAMTFWVPPQYRVSAGLVILRKYTPMEFTLIKSRAMTLSRSPQYRAFSRAVMDEKSSSPLFPVGGGTVVTNDWCISSRVKWYFLFCFQFCSKQ